MQISGKMKENKGRKHRNTQHRAQNIKGRMQPMQTNCIHGGETEVCRRVFATRGMCCSFSMMSALVQERTRASNENRPPDGERWRQRTVGVSCDLPPFASPHTFPIIQYTLRPLPAAPSDATLQSKSAITVRRACSVSRVDTGVFTI